MVFPVVGFAGSLERLVVTGVDGDVSDKKWFPYDIVHGMIGVGRDGAVDENKLFPADMGNGIPKAMGNGIELDNVAAPSN